jgi:hypothetical protein
MGQGERSEQVYWLILLTGAWDNWKGVSFLIPTCIETGMPVGMPVLIFKIR